MIRFSFNERKAAQAAAHLIQQSGGRMNYVVLIKLLYLADREALIETGRPITGDRMVAMPHGPVLSLIYDAINMGKLIAEPSTPWYEYVSEPDGYDVTTGGGDGFDELSRYEIGVLGRVLERYGKLDKWALRDFTHTLPEWSDPHGSSFAIAPEEILRAAGRSEEDIARIAIEAENVRFIRQLVPTAE